MASSVSDPPALDAEPATDITPWVLEDKPRLRRKLAELGELLCTPAEVAELLGVDEDQLTPLLARPRPRAAFAAGRARGFGALRRAQLKLAQSHASMAIFLGKTCLGQGEAQEAERSDEIDASQAGQRVRDKLAAIAAETAAEGDREGE